MLIQHALLERDRISPQICSSTKILYKITADEWRALSSSHFVSNLPQTSALKFRLG